MSVSIWCANQAARRTCETICCLHGKRRRPIGPWPSFGFRFVRRRHTESRLTVTTTIAPLGTPPGSDRPGLSSVPGMNDQVRHHRPAKALAVLVLCVVAGLLVAALALPVVAGIGLGAKASADFFNDLPTNLVVVPLAQRSVIEDRTATRSPPCMGRRTGSRCRRLTFLCRCGMRLSPSKTDASMSITELTTKHYQSGAEKPGHRRCDPGRIDTDPAVRQNVP